MLSCRYGAAPGRGQGAHQERSPSGAGDLPRVHHDDSGCPASARSSSIYARRGSAVAPFSTRAQASAPDDAASVGKPGPRFVPIAPGRERPPPRQHKRRSSKVTDVRRCSPPVSSARSELRACQFDARRATVTMVASPGEVVVSAVAPRHEFTTGNNCAVALARSCFVPASGWRSARTAGSCRPAPPNASIRAAWRTPELTAMPRSDGKRFLRLSSCLVLPLRAYGISSRRRR